MPYMKNGKRDYAREYANYHSKPEQKKNRAARNAAHGAMEIKLGHKTHADVDHVKPISKGGSNNASNLRVASASANRSFSRNADGSLKSQKSKREK